MKRVTKLSAVLLTALSSLFSCNDTKNKDVREMVILADREAPLGWVYLRIYEDSTFEFESKGLERKGHVYSGKIDVRADTLYFNYQDSVPKAGKVAVLSDQYISYLDGDYQERLEIKTNNLIQLPKDYSEDCVFDLKTQNFDFLSGIPELESLVWIDSIKTAIGKLDDDSIQIHRGGCVHFDFTVTITTSDQSELSDHAYWYKKIRKATELLGHEFENILIDSLYSNKKYSLEHTDTQYYFFFDQEMYCSMEFVIEKTNVNTIVSLGYYLC